jgi:predicted metalloendopeptidase
MTVNLKTAFKSLVEEAKWMDVATKTTAREKVQ